MTALDRVYHRFARTHYVGRRLRRPEHVQALLEAAAIPPGKIDAAFWQRVRSEWLWGVSPAPFEGADADRTNATYRRLCRSRGISP